MAVRGKQIENSHPEDDVMIQAVRKLVEVQVVVLLNMELVSVQILGLHIFVIDLPTSLGLCSLNSLLDFNRDHWHLPDGSHTPCGPA